jgi:antirestriction protein ArdC
LELGGNVRKGSKGTTVVYANKLVVKDSETDDERAIPFLKRYTVFNADQVEGLDGKYPAPAPIITNPETRDVELEVMFSRIDATVRIGGSQAYYHTRDDYIQMPLLKRSIPPTTTMPRLRTRPCIMQGMKAASTGKP